MTRHDEAIPSQWSHTVLTKQFDCFRIIADRCSEDGCLEYLMVAD